MPATRPSTPLHGTPFGDIMSELYAHALTGAPGQSDPFVLSLFDRECISYALALYYDCAHCQVHHHAAVAREAAKTGSLWPWKKRILDIVLFTKIEQRDLAPALWERWQEDWDRHVKNVGPAHEHVAEAIMFAIAMSRADVPLMKYIGPRLCALFPEYDRALGMLRDVLRVFGFMKMATSMNRVIPDLRELLAACAHK